MAHEEYSGHGVAEVPEHLFYEQLRLRLNEVRGERSIREIARLTRTNPETVRRYLSSGVPSARFLAVLADRLQISPSWLLFGQRRPRPQASPQRRTLSIEAETRPGSPRLKIIRAAILDSSPHIAES